MSDDREEEPAAKRGHTDGDGDGNVDADADGISSDDSEGMAVGMGTIKGGV